MKENTTPHNPVIISISLVVHWYRIRFGPSLKMRWNCKRMAILMNAVAVG